MPMATSMARKMKKSINPHEGMPELRGDRSESPGVREDFSASGVVFAGSAMSSFECTARDLG
jgi:hypothetical protein